ncbi:MAG TPA: hypothetical protein VM261_19545 [Kofleriaceae bacterium]|nr:hypothetical protein [Kofleriaceae bacterium]
MRTILVSVSLVVACSGSDEVVNGNDAARVDAGGDDATTDAGPVDGLPVIALTGIEVGFAGGRVPEGTGDDGGRPALLILSGTDIFPNAVVTATLAGTVLPSTFRSFGGTTGGALTVEIPVLTDLARGETRQVVVTASQHDATSTVTFEIDGLDELALGASGAATVDAVPALYSRITISGDRHYTAGQTAPLVLRATGGITITSARVDVDAVGRVAGAHGCDGGAAAAAGACGVGGGGNGGSAAVVGDGSGGGGGGFGTTGVVGAGGTGGAVGMVTGGDMMVPFVSTAGTAGNRGNGGGGGGAGMLVVGTAAGGAGGGGGGAVMLDAGGDITVTGAGAAMSASGASGSAGAGAAGGGGGGSGGAILVRSGGTISAPAAWLSAAGGGSGPGNNAGGSGGVGRVRIDVGSGDTSGMATTPASVRGPAWAPGTPTITTSPSGPLPLIGQPGRTYGIRLNGAAAGDVTLDGTGNGTATPTLTMGRNRVCVLWTTNAAATDLDKPEAQSCVDIAFTNL